MDKKDRIVLPKGSEYTVEITEVNNLGSGVGHVQGKVVFVRGAVTGDVVRISVIKDTATYAVGRVLQIEKASDVRDPQVFCEAPDACGGCVHRYVTYAHELVIDLLLLCLKLHLVRQRLPFTSTADAEMLAERLQTVL